MAEGETLRQDTLAVGAGYDGRDHQGAVKPPLISSSTFLYPTAQHAKDAHVAFFGDGDRPHAGYIYARLDHPNMAMLQARMAALDGAEDAAVFNCGMAAVTCVLQTLLRPGQVLLHTRPIYGGTDALIYTHLTEFGIIPIVIGDAIDPASVRAAAASAMAAGQVGAVWVETPANPTSGIADIALIAAVAGEIAAAQGTLPPVIVDNTFLGPFLQSPLRHGADLCMTSLTKYAGGHSDLLGGSVSGSRALVHRLKQLRTFLGSPLDAHSCWMLLRSLETLHLRCERAGRNALAVAEFLRAHSKVAHVAYIGFQPPGSAAHAVFTRQCAGAGSTFSFRVQGDEAAVFRMLDRLAVIRMAVSLGGTETLICHPASTTHCNVPAERRAAVGIDDGVLRLSVGVEHEMDLIGDLRQAMEAI